MKNKLSNFKSYALNHKQRSLIALVIVLVVIGLGLWGWTFYRQLHPANEQVKYDTSGFPESISLMTTTQKEIYLKAKTHYDLQTIENWQAQDVNQSKFKDFDEANIIAQVYATMDKYKAQALAAYQAADSFSGNHSYDFYKAYANAAAQVKDESAYMTALKKAKQSVENDTSLDPAIKKRDLGEINWLMSNAKEQF